MLSFCVVLVCVLLQSQVALSTMGSVYRTEGTTEPGLDDTVILGALFPVRARGTSQPCGDLTPTYVQLVEAMVLAIRLINENSTLLPNINLAFDIRDTCRSVNFALQQSLDYIQSGINCTNTVGSGPGPSAVLGAFVSTISEAAANLFGLFEVPQVSYGSSATLLSEERFSYFFRTVPSDLFQARALADIIIKFGWDYIILLHSNDLYGNGGIAALRNELERNRNNSEICIALQMSLDGSNNETYRDALRTMNQPWVRNASVVLLFGHVEDAMGMFRAIYESIMDDPDFPLQNLTWIGSDSWGDNLPDMYRPLASGMLSTVPQSDPIVEFNNYFTSLDPVNNSANPWFAEYWENEFNCSLSPPNQDCDVENQVISAGSTNYTQFSLVPLVFDAVFVVAHAVQNLITIHCPNGDLCPNISADGVIDGALLRESILNISIPSQSVENATLSFDSNGDVENSYYSVLNLQRISDTEYSYIPVGSWQGSLSINDERIQWVGETQEVPESVCSLPCAEGHVSMPVPGQQSCCFMCRPCANNTAAIDNICFRCDSTPGMKPNENRTSCVMIPITFLTWSNPWAILLVTLCSIGIVVTCIVVVIFLVNYKHELIKASSRELSAILLVGLLLCYIMPFFYIAKPSAAICAIRRFGVGFCFAISYSALLVKTNRIHRIFSRSAKSSVKQLKFISPVSQVIITAGFISVQVVIALVSLAIDQPGTMIEASLTSNELTCASDPVVDLVVSLGYTLFLLILCTYFAFLTRKVPANFNETKFIGATVYSTCLIWLAFVPTYFATAALGTIFQATTLAFGIIFSATTTLCCLFISKVFLLSARIRKQRKTENSLHTNSGSGRVFSQTSNRKPQRPETVARMELENSTLKSPNGDNSVLRTPSVIVDQL